MSYKLDYARYLPAPQDARIVHGIKGNRVPRGAIRGGNGTFLVSQEQATFYMFFEDQNGERRCYSAYGAVKSNMVTERLTKKKCLKIEEEVRKIALQSSEYEPERWVEEAVRKLKL